MPGLSDRPDRAETLDPSSSGADRPHAADVRVPSAGDPGRRDWLRDYELDDDVADGSDAVPKARDGDGTAREGEEPPAPMPPDALPDDVAFAHVDAAVHDDAPLAVPAPRADGEFEDPHVEAAGDQGRVAGDGDTAGEGDQPTELRALVDRPDIEHMYDPHVLPTRYGDPLREGRDRPVPLFDGPPAREQTQQGGLGDCGVIAALGAVAGHRPEAIRRCIRENDDGTYEVTLHEATPAGPDGVSQPTGRTIKLTVTPDLPVHEHNPGQPAFAQSSRAAWAPILEKAIAGLDQTWTPERRAVWEADWRERKKAREKEFGTALPDGPAPPGYGRLHQGTNEPFSTCVLPGRRGGGGVVEPAGRGAATCADADRCRAGGALGCHRDPGCPGSEPR